jgi:hypothetical protein
MTNPLHNNFEIPKPYTGVPVLYSDLNRINESQRARFLGNEVDDRLSRLMEAVVNPGKLVGGIESQTGIRDGNTIFVGHKSVRVPDQLTIPDGTVLTSQPYDLLLYRNDWADIKLITHSLAWAYLLYYRSFVLWQDIAMIERFFTGLDESRIDEVDA